MNVGVAIKPDKCDSYSVFLFTRCFPVDGFRVRVSSLVLEVDTACSVKSKNVTSNFRPYKMRIAGEYKCTKL